MLMLLDSAGLYFRAYYAVPTSITAPDGTPVNAARGFLTMLASLVASRRPTELVACWDNDWRPAWRVALLPSYKAHRVAGLDDSPRATTTGGSSPGWAEEVPDDLTPQVGIITEVLAAFGIPIIGADGFEADDVMATIAWAAAAPDRPVEVVTGDRDLLALVDDQRAIRVVYTGRGMARITTYDEAAVRAEYGVPAAAYADFAVLRGDPSDGLPGVAGVGAKTAAALLAAHGDIPGILAAAQAGSPVMRPAVAAKLLAANDYLDAALPVVRPAQAPIPAGRWPVPAAPRNPQALEVLAERWGLAGAIATLGAALAADPHQAP